MSLREKVLFPLLHILYTHTHSLKGRLFGGCRGFPKNVSTNVFVWNIIIYKLLNVGYFKKCKIEKMSTLLFELEKWSIPPNGFRIHFVIKGHKKMQPWHNFSIISWNGNERNSANLFSHTNLINGFWHCNKGRLEEAIKLIE